MRWIVVAAYCLLSVSALAEAPLTEYLHFATMALCRARSHQMCRDMATGADGVHYCRTTEEDGAPDSTHPSEQYPSLSGADFAATIADGGLYWDCLPLMNGNFGLRIDDDNADYVAKPREGIGLTGGEIAALVNRFNEGTNLPEQVAAATIRAIWTEQRLTDINTWVLANNGETFPIGSAWDNFYVSGFAVDLGNTATRYMWSVLLTNGQITESEYNAAMTPQTPPP